MSEGSTPPRDETKEVKYWLSARTRLLVLAFLIGSLLSLPLRVLVRLAVTGLNNAERSFEPPNWAYTMYYYNWAACFLLLPLWTSLFVKDQPPAWRLGRIVWMAFVLLLLLSVFFPFT